MDREAIHDQTVTEEVTLESRTYPDGYMTRCDAAGIDVEEHTSLEQARECAWRQEQAR